MSTAFVLSGGGSLGAVQVGMARALYDRGIHPDFWVGTSVGALNATFLAARPPVRASTDALARLWLSVRRGDVFPLRPLAGFFGFFGSSDHLVPPGPLRRLLGGTLGIARLEDAKQPVHVVATEMQGGRERLISRGPAIEAVMASVSLPGVFPPVPWDDVKLMDGGVSNNTPISHAIELGADEVYVLPAGAGCAIEQAPRGALGMLMHALNLMLMRHLLTEIERLRPLARLFVVPPPCPQIVSPIDFDHAARLIDAGERACLTHLDDVVSGRRASATLFGMPHGAPGQVPGPR